MNIFVTKPFLPPIEEFFPFVERIWKSGLLTNHGPIHKEFEEELGKYLKSKNITLCVNGHSALEIAIKGLELKGEVITTPFTFASTTHAIVANNLKPVFCDIKPEDFTIDENKIESLITENTSAILPVHVYGYPCNVFAIEKIAQKYNLKVIYDAAHAFGVEINGVPIGNFGDVSMFSFHATKLFHSIEGGALVYNNPEYKRVFELYKNFGIAGPEVVELVGGNAKMNEFQAAMGLVNLKHIDEIISRREDIIIHYQDRLGGIKGLDFVGDLPKIRLNYAYFPILIDKKSFGMSRDEVFSILEAQSIYARKYFYPLVTKFDCYKDTFGDMKCPVAESVGERVLTLPLYTELEMKDVDNICDILEDLNRLK